MTKLFFNIPSFVLASASPRRQELLASLNIPFDVIPSSVVETALPGESPREFVTRLSFEKARDVHAVCVATGDSRPVLGADTIVVIDDRIIGKPNDRDHARIMLKSLSGRSHHVLTGVCLLTEVHTLRRVVTTEVTFKSLLDDEIERYLDQHEWHDKAGAYAIQSGAAYMVQRIVGSYTNVVGLPLCEVTETFAAIASAS